MFDKNLFPVLKNNSDLIYLDSASTTLKPQNVIDAEVEFLIKNGANPHTDAFENAIIATEMIEKTRKTIANFIGVTNANEIVLTSGTTMSINQIAYGLKHLLQPGDEILITDLEHTANLLPWMVVAKETGAIIKNLILDSLTMGVDPYQLDKVITDKTKIVAFAHATNTIGYLNDVQLIAEKIKQINAKIIIAIDAAQSIAHCPINLQTWDIDFLAFSAHKIYGPFGVGVLWGKMAWLQQMPPLVYGGGMSKNITDDYQTYQLADVPFKFEAGTQNPPAIQGFGEAITWMSKIGMEQIHQYETELKQYAVAQIKKLGLEAQIDFYNLNNLAPILTFNVKGWNGQDVANYLDAKHHIAVRMGEHCARLTGKVYAQNSLRASFGIYTTKADIDILLKALTKQDEFLDIYFNEVT
ncbi:aminotransferase class V-fold PLP-dependent enzyme [Williamsoniiplasma lucivorax]|uniref:cysteine desulfurase n=1 Tax=Williamsoniiplasma lucivorax TaxID=209274 RepID=A0A2S5RDQ7_9MOLU|nr:aminotransferase class V-fold PLP-dependent enzyme [Williamsoniiplasma lucivorax]PPE05434.1 cysteine desulfurase [Williamsoniiplasma lucivorax]